MADETRFKDLNVEINILNAQAVLEEKARNSWRKKWGFYLDFNQFLKEELSKRGITYERYKQLMKKNNTFTNTKIDDTIKIESSDFIPYTSNSIVGWRSQFKYTLEKFGGPLYISPKHTLPYEPPYSCIKLG